MTQVNSLEQQILKQKQYKDILHQQHSKELYIAQSIQGSWQALEGILLQQRLALPARMT